MLKYIYFVNKCFMNCLKKVKSGYLKDKKAFTLAEVLITLAIIGVVAALTVPTLQKNYKALQFKAGFKKAYAETGQLAKYMQLDYGSEDLYSALGTANSGGSNESIAYGFAKSVESYYKSIKNNPKRYLYNKILDKNGKEIIYKNHTKTTPLIAGMFDDGGFELLDGRVIIFEGGFGSRPFMITYDINGMNSGPNAWGYDLFSFVLAPNGLFYPAGSPVLKDLINEAKMDEHFCEHTSGCSKTSKSNCNGISCANEAVKNHNYFNELKF